MSAQGAKSANELAEDRTDLAVVRTVMAADRSLMAWIRTALSMISFGFTIYKLLESFQEKGLALPNVNSPKRVGLFLVGLGTVSLVMGTVQFWLTLKDLHRLQRVQIWRSAFIIALIMSVTGLFLFFGIISRIF